MQNIFNNRGEGHINTAVKIIIAVIIGALILGGIYLLFAGDGGIMGKLDDEVNEMMDYDPEVQGYQVQINEYTTLNDISFTYDGKTWHKANVVGYREDAEVKYFVSHKSMAAMILQEGDTAYLISTPDGETWTKHKAYTNVRYDKSTILKWVDDAEGGHFYAVFRRNDWGNSWESSDGIRWTTDNLGIHYFS